LLEFKWI